MFRVRLTAIRAAPALNQSRIIFNTVARAFSSTSPTQINSKKVLTDSQKAKELEQKAKLKAKYVAAKAKESLKLKEEKALLKTKLVSKKKQEKEIAKLSLKLAKEKEWLATLRGRFKEASKSHEAKEAAREKKLLSKILKQYRKLNSYAYFIKTQKGQTLIQSKEKWLALSEYEKEDLQDQTDAYNEQQLKIYKPKPKKPATGFALYVKENFVSDGRSVVEINKDLSKQWNSLNEHQKGEYKIGQDVKDEYKRALDAWVENRIDIYKSSVSSV